MNLNMHILPGFLLLVAAILAKNSEQKPQDSYSNPIDFFYDDILRHNTNLNPNSTLTFNFEQKRHDQPPHVVMRNENIFKYFYNRAQTTTPAPSLPMTSDKDTPSVYPNIIPVVNYPLHQQGYWNNRQPQHQNLQITTPVPFYPIIVSGDNRNDHSKMMSTINNPYQQGYWNGQKISSEPLPSKPQTTTSVHTNSQDVYPKVMPVTNNHQQQGYHNEERVSTVPPPPTFAPLQSQSSSQRTELQGNSPYLWNNPSVQLNAQTRNTFENLHSRPLGQTRPPVPMHWTESSSIQSTPTPYLAVSHPKTEEVIRFAPSESYISDSFTNKKSDVPHQLTQGSRGSHKFSWSDIESDKLSVTTPKAVVPQISTAAKTIIHNKPLPPAPTLSPWYDNFGK